MPEPYISEIRTFAFGRWPRGWLPCNGQVVPKRVSPALFALIGSMYGGDGETTFGLPNLNGRVPVGASDQRPHGRTGGTRDHKLALEEMPEHRHKLNASTAGADTPRPSGSMLCVTNDLYADAGSLTALHPSASEPAGASQPHQNMQPFLALTFCIAFEGLFPSRP